MMIFALVVGWLIGAVVTGVVDLWRQINFSQYAGWKDLKPTTVNRELLGIFWLCLWVWPFIACFLVFEAFIFSKDWFQSAEDRFARWVFVKLKR